MRRSPFATNPRFDVAVETLCTLRHWQSSGSRTSSTHSSTSSSSHSNSSGSTSSHAKSATRRHSNSSSNSNSYSNRFANVLPPMPQKGPIVTGPELILAPVQDVLDNRDITPIRHRHRLKQVGTATNHNYNYNEYSIPLSEIVVVERMPPPASSRRHRSTTSKATASCASFQLTVTTIHQGVLEFELHNANHHDLLLAFLQAHLPAERIQTVATTNGTDCGVSVHSTCSSKSQMDVDRLQEKTMRQHEAQETWPQKLSRRVSKVVTSLQDMSGTICDLTVCGGGSSGTAAAACRQDDLDDALARHDDVREEAPRTVLSKSPTNITATSSGIPLANGGHLEMDEEMSTVTSRKSRTSSSWHQDPALQSVVLV